MAATCILLYPLLTLRPWCDLGVTLQVFDRHQRGYIDGGDLKGTMEQLGVVLTEEDVHAMMQQAGCKITDRVYYEGRYHHPR